LNFLFGREPLLTICGINSCRLWAELAYQFPAPPSGPFRKTAPAKREKYFMHYFIIYKVPFRQWFLLRLPRSLQRPREVHSRVALAKMFCLGCQKPPAPRGGGRIFKKISLKCWRDQNFLLGGPQASGAPGGPIFKNCPRSEGFWFLGYVIFFSR
jgi:hypothetical protein